MDPEVQAAQERVAATEPGEAVEVERAEAGEVVETEGNEQTEGEAAERTEPEAVRTEPTPADDRFARLERQNAELAEQLTRLSGRDRVVEDKPPVQLDQIETKADLAKYLEWNNEKLRRELSASFREDSASVHAEQRARGLFNRNEMGQGRDYDSLITKHIAPVEQVDPSFRRFFNSQQDPATARYVTAAVLEVIERAKGDPVKGVANLWAALDGKQATTSRVLKDIRSAAEKQVGKTNLRAARATEPSDKAAAMARDAKSLHPSEFAAKYPKLVNGF